jgi:hypothetical protein
MCRYWGTYSLDHTSKSCGRVTPVFDWNEDAVLSQADVLVDVEAARSTRRNSVAYTSFLHVQRNHWSGADGGGIRDA